MAFQPGPGLARMDGDVHITGLYFSPWVGILPVPCPFQQKNGMGTIRMHVFSIDGAHGMILLPQNTISALN